MRRPHPWQRDDVTGCGREYHREVYLHDAFGQPTISDWWDNPRVDANNQPQSWYENRFMFEGREWIKELGIYDYRHRMYHPGLGRFLQTDPTGFDAGDMNLYRYCDDDPVDRTDPTGLWTRDWQAAMQAIDQGGLLSFFDAERMASQNVTVAGSSGQNGKRTIYQAPENYNPSQLEHGNDPWSLIRGGASQAYEAGKIDQREHHRFIFQNPANPKDFVRTPLRISGLTDATNETTIFVPDKTRRHLVPPATVGNYKYWGVAMNEVRYNQIRINIDLGIFRAHHLNGVIMTPSPSSASGAAHSPPYFYDAQHNSTYGP